MTPWRLRPAARADRREAVRYYREQGGQALADRLIDELDESLRLLSRQPHIGSPRLQDRMRIDELRSWRLTRFPLIWVYRAMPDHVDIVRLLSERQDIATLIEKDLL